MGKSTNKELVDELRLMNKDGNYDEIIADAVAGEFHDYKNKKYVCGKIELYAQLARFPELWHIREGIKNGVYDESMDEDDKEAMRQDLINDMGQKGARAFFKHLGL